MRSARVHCGSLQAPVVLVLAALGWSVAAADEATSATNDVAALDALRVQGEDLYIKNCRQCHGTNGTSGVPLAGNHRIADPAHVVHVIINGPRYMPAFGKFLTDDQIAAVATYVSTSWGNTFGGVTADEVAGLR